MIWLCVLLYLFSGWGFHLIVVDSIILDDYSTIQYVVYYVLILLFWLPMLVFTGLINVIYNVYHEIKRIVG